MMRPQRPRYKMQGAEKLFCGFNLVATAVIFAAGSRTFFFAALAAAVVFIHIAGVVMLASGSIRLRTGVLLSCLTALATLLFLPVIAVNWLIYLRSRRADAAAGREASAAEYHDRGDTK